MQDKIILLLTLLAFSTCTKLEEDINSVTEEINIDPENFFNDSIYVCSASNPLVSFNINSADQDIRINEIDSEVYGSPFSIKTIDSFIYGPDNPLPDILLKENSFYSQYHFFYNEDSNLNKVEIYDSTQTTNQNSILFDTLKYNELGQLIQVVRMRLKDSLEYYERQSIEYTYKDGVPAYSIRTSFNQNGNSNINSYNKYCWENGNLKQVNSYDNDGDIFRKAFYKYDDKPNYRKVLPTSYEFPISWSENNLIETSTTLYGLPSYSICGSPCPYSIEYNDFDYPIRISSVSSIIEISYE